MVHCLTKKKSKVYRYYVCQTAIKRGYSKCRTGSLVARRVKQTASRRALAPVFDECRAIGKPGLAPNG